MTLLITDGLPRGLGHLEIDQRNVSAPLPPGQRYFECDTYTCTHCSQVVALNPARVRPRYKCKGCNHHLCDGCAAVMATGAVCRTMAQIAEEYLESVARHPETSSIILP